MPKRKNQPVKTPKPVLPAFICEDLPTPENVAEGVESRLLVSRPFVFLEAATGSELEMLVNNWLRKGYALSDTQCERDSFFQNHTARLVHPHYLAMVEHAQDNFGHKLKSRKTKSQRGQGLIVLMESKSGNSASLVKSKPKGVI